MNRPSAKALVPFLVIVAVAIAAVVFLGIVPEEDTGGPAEFPAAEQNDGGVPVDAPSEDASENAEPDPAVIDPSVTVEDPVPDAVVAVLFDLLKVEDISPLMQETYTVEFVETTDKVRIEGEFEGGDGEFEFEFEDGEWKLEESS